MSKTNLEKIKKIAPKLIVALFLSYFLINELKTFIIIVRFDLLADQGFLHLDDIMESAFYLFVLIVTLLLIRTRFFFKASAFFFFISLIEVLRFFWYTLSNRTLDFLINIIVKDPLTYFLPIIGLGFSFWFIFNENQSSLKVNEASIRFPKNTYGRWGA